MVGWYGGHCGHCESCRRVDFITCRYAQIPDISYNGGYSDYTIVPAEAIAPIPDEFTAPEAAPLLCAGITSYIAVRNSGARAGDIVALQRIGGRGHLGVQFASKMGYRAVAISRGKNEEELVKKLGAIQYIDNRSQNAVELHKMVVLK